MPLFKDTRYTDSTTTHAMLRDFTQPFVSNDIKEFEELYYKMMYERGIGSMTRRIMLDRALRFQDGIWKEEKCREKHHDESSKEGKEVQCQDKTQLKTPKR